jgi:hypothetical protein
VVGHFRLSRYEGGAALPYRPLKSMSAGILRLEIDCLEPPLTTGKMMQTPTDFETRYGRSSLA